MARSSSHPNLGKIHIANQVTSSKPDSRRTKVIIFLLSGSVALMFTGFGIILPVFARRLGEFGSGVREMGFMVMAFALAQFIASPFMGSLADRIGRKPIILVSLGSFVVANIGLLLAQSTMSFTIVRVFEAAFGAGLLPAAMSMVGDLVPENRRARWIGIVMAGMGAGFVMGPVVGGVLYDAFGFKAPFIASAALGLVAFCGAILLVPETKTRAVRHREKILAKRNVTLSSSNDDSLLASLPRPLTIFCILLFVDFVSVFSFAYIEPQMLFYVYDDLNWTTIQFGVVVAFYGAAMVVGQVLLGGLSDKYGRKKMIIIGVACSASLPLGLVLTKSFIGMLGVATIAGLGAALMAPALSALYLDMTDDKHRSRIMGIKGSAASLGGVIGPLLVMPASALTTPRGVFLSASIIIAVTVGVVFFGLKELGRPGEKTEDMSLEAANQRALAAQAAMRGIVMDARSARVLRQK